jgi:hypothetical protein
VKRPLALALLAFACGCGEKPMKTEAPAPATSSAPAPPSAPTMSGPDGAGPAPAKGNRFIVCPGDRRCPRRNDGKLPEGAD